MIRIVTLVVCLPTCTCRIALSQNSLAHSPKSVGTATGYSVYGTGIPIVAGGIVYLAAVLDDPDDPSVDAVGCGIAVGALGGIIGPGLGHAYAGQRWHFLKGSLIRTVGAAFIATGVTQEVTPRFDGDEEDNDGGATALIGCVLYLWSAIHDFRTLDDAVERYNKKHAAFTFGVGPTYFVHERALGGVLTLRF